MYKKKSRFLTFIFSMLPGAGHMYLGLMKNGISLMSVFFFLFFIASWFNIGALMYVIPVVWFYAFFDCLNKSGMDEEEFLGVKDEYLFSIGSLMKIDDNVLKKRGAIIGICLLIFGCYLLLNNLTDFIMPFFPQQVVRIINDIIEYIPKIIVSVIIIFIGISLISGKKRESEKDND